MSEKRKPGCKYTIEQEKEIISTYLDGKSLRDLGKQWECSPTTIKNILKEYDISTRNLSQARRNYLNYTLNENIFEKIDNPDKAYWLGVMYSDGYISKAREYTNSFGLSVSEKDLEWVEKFKQFLGYNGEIKHYIVSYVLCQDNRAGAIKMLTYAFYIKIKMCYIKIFIKSALVCFFHSTF